MDLASSSGFVNYMVGGRFDPPFMPTKTFPYIKGLQLQLDGQVGEKSIELVLDFDIELLSVAVGSSKYQANDNWDFIIGDDDNVKVCESIYTKDLPEGMYFVAVIPVQAGTKMKFIYRNNGGAAKYAWFNLQCLRDEPTPADETTTPTP